MNNLNFQLAFVHTDATEARFKRRTSHLPNSMQINLNKRLSSFTLSSVYVKFDVWNGFEGVLTFWRKRLSTAKALVNIGKSQWQDDFSRNIEVIIN